MLMTRPGVVPRNSEHTSVGRVYSSRCSVKQVYFRTLPLFPGYSFTVFKFLASVPRERTAWAWTVAVIPSLYDSINP